MKKKRYLDSDIVAAHIEGDMVVMTKSNGRIEIRLLDEKELKELNKEERNKFRNKIAPALNYIAFAMGDREEREQAIKLEEFYGVLEK